MPGPSTPSEPPAHPTVHLENTRPRNADPEAGEPCHRAVEHVTSEPIRLAVMRLSRRPAHGTARRVAGERGLTSGGCVERNEHRLRECSGTRPEPLLQEPFSEARSLPLETRV